MADTKKGKAFVIETADLPKILKPVDLGGMYADKLQVDMDCKDDRVMGLASGLLVSYPHRDFAFVARFDEPFLKERDERKRKERDVQKARVEELELIARDGKDAKQEDGLGPGPESYASVFSEYMNVYNFGQMDMVNPEEKVEYVAYLSHLEKTLSSYLGTEIDVNGNQSSNKANTLPRVAQNNQGKGADSTPERSYKKLRLVITSVDN